MFYSPSFAVCLVSIPLFYCIAYVFSYVLQYGTKMRQKLDWTTLAHRRKLYTLKAVNSQVHPRVYISPS